MTDDATLLHRYARERSEAAFGELVSRHVDFVYASALRRVNGDTHLAEDVTSMVFADLARKAASIPGERVLAGWLFTSTRYAASKLVRTEQRRRTREQEAFFMDEPTATDADSRRDWEQMRPVLDDALADLKDSDRDAILLRYFEGRDFAEVGARLALSANAARMRVERALEKLRGSLARRGATSSVAALSLALTSHATVTAPVGLAATVTGAALASGTASVAALTFMGLTKLQSGIAVGVLAVGAAVYIPQELAADGLRAELAAQPAVQAEIRQLREDNRQLARTLNRFDHLQVSEAELTRLRDELIAKRKAVAELHASRARASAPPSPAPFKGPTVPISQLDVRPRPAVMKAPTYPAEMAAAGVEGSADVLFVIDAQGKVVRAEVRKSTHPEFEMPALTAIRQWEFSPGEKAGVPVNTEVMQKMLFTMNSNQPAPTPADWF